MGSSKKQTVGYWYKLLYHAGLAKGPIDAFLEFRGGDKTAWKGALTASGTININQPNLWGGEKDQGGIVSDVDVMFGEATQAPNAYLLANLGAQVPAWRGLATLVFKGGRYGAMNPYPQKASYKIRKIKQGWDGACWYPETAEILTSSDSSSVVVADTALDATALVVTNPLGVSFGGSPSDIFRVTKSEGMAFKAWSPYGADDGGGHIPPIPGHTWLNVFDVTTEAGTTSYWQGWYQTEEDAFQAVLGSSVLLTGYSEYTISIYDPAPLENRGGLSVRVEKITNIAMNPAHILYFARTNSDMGREPTANINDASLRAAADTLYAEGFGICTTRDPAQESVEEFEGRIAKLIDGSFSRDPITGLWHLDLSRGDYVLGDLPILTDDDILEFRELPSTLDNAINSVSVTYFDPERKESITTPPVQARALIQDFGTINQTIEYPEIPTADLAARVALRELRATATPTRAFDLVCTRVPFAWRPNTYFRLQVPKRGIADMVCIVGEKESGSLKSGAIKLKAAQDIYSMPATSFVEIEPGVDTSPSQTPEPITAQAAFEAPYIEVASALSRADLAVLPADVGYLATVAADPSLSVDYTVMVDSGAGYLQTATGDWAPTGTIIEASWYDDTIFTVAGGSRLDEVAIGSAALWGSEIVRVDALDVVTGALTLGRGCADTVPVQHAAGERIWFYGDNEAIDQTEYTDAETVAIKLLTNTGSQQLDLADATAIPLTFASRAARPYPPGNVRINGVSYPVAFTGNPLLTFDWSHRDRVLQADQLVDTLQASIGPEAGATYTLRLYGETDALLRTETGLMGTTYTWVDEEADSGLTIPGASGYDYAAEVLADSPVGYWKLDETSGTTAIDSVGSNDGTYAGATLNQNPLIQSGRSALFSGFNSGITIPDAANLSFVATAFSLEAWVKTAASAVGIIVAKDTTFTIWPEYSLNMNANGTVTCTVRSSNADNPKVTATTTAVVNDDQPHCVTALFTPSATLKIYIDAVERASVNHSMSTSFDSTAFLRIGRGDDTSAIFSGGIDEVALYASALSPARITAHCVAGSSAVNRLNGSVRAELESVRDGLTSHQTHDITVDRAGWGYNWGNYWGGI